MNVEEYEDALSGKKETVNEEIESPQYYYLDALIKKLVDYYKWRLMPFLELEHKLRCMFNRAEIYNFYFSNTELIICDVYQVEHRYSLLL